jgi:hypothetical protein
MQNHSSKLLALNRAQMSRLNELVRERRRRQENPDRILAIFNVFIDPATKKEATDLPRTAIVIGGPELQQEPNETAEGFKARVMAIARQLRKQNEHVA